LSGGEDELVGVGGEEAKVGKRVRGDEVVSTRRVLLVGVGRASSVRRGENANPSHGGGGRRERVGRGREEGLRSRKRRVEERGRRNGGGVRSLREEKSLSSELTTSEQDRLEKV